MLHFLYLLDVRAEGLAILRNHDIDSSGIPWKKMKQIQSRHLTSLAA